MFHGGHYLEKGCWAPVIALDFNYFIVKNVQIVGKILGIF